MLTLICSSTILFNTVPVWITEIVPPKNRGVLVDLHPIMINIGYMLSSWVGVGFYFSNENGSQWRGPLAVGCLWPLLCMICVPFAPESPRYLLMKEKDDRAWAIVKDLHSRPEDTGHSYAWAEYRQMNAQISLERKLRVGYWGMFTRKSYLKRILIGCGLIFFLETSGTLVINSRLTYLLNPYGCADSSRKSTAPICIVALALDL